MPIVDIAVYGVALPGLISGIAFLLSAREGFHKFRLWIVYAGILLAVGVSSMVLFGFPAFPPEEMTG